MSAVPVENWIDIPGVGSLVGLAVGDALGTTFEFERVEQPPYPALATGPATDVVGGGPFELPAGAITDDTQMAVCLARSLLEKRELDLLDVATRYVAWSQHAFDIGSQTGSSLSAIESGTSVGAAGRAVWHRSGRRAAGNGSLMRCAPIGVWFAGEPLEKIVEASLADSLITHADPRCAIACATFNAAIARGVAGRKSSTSMTSTSTSTTTDIAGAQVDTARAAIPIAAARLRELWDDDRDDLAAVDAAVDAINADLDLAAAGHPDLHSGAVDLQRTQGFVRVAFRLAFWHLVHTASWRDALVDVASRGGDADTNAAIAGALLGARDGARAIPPAWLERVLAAPQRGPAAWGDAHHPRHLVALAKQRMLPA